MKEGMTKVTHQLTGVCDKILNILAIKCEVGIVISCESCPSYLFFISSSVRLIVMVCSILCVSRTRYWYFCAPCERDE